ncbi:H-2 class II histocompatibility antigen, A-U alpha chain-like [Sphaeramia orbicularis]|uniref:H-2 class II histocompatibility antigen, A-U alpha chain-like n=1 Tax=Sphaeramia orbicularis TaxID=375764 RepID=UPI00117EB9B1|nr:H-2 class II histocompatibility antigen, A-U alpha chain-like [Sphaeramia orbicularis]XP_030014744.1 H-2 class II histocompatibility antigen, A-U alpha chain-like [Sphaeramia orbicularis]
MMRFTIIILILNAIGAFSQTPSTHEFTFYMGCSFNGTAEVGFQVDDEQLMYVDFHRQKVVVTLPQFIVYNPSELIAAHYVYRNSVRNRKYCLSVLYFLKELEKLKQSTIPPEVEDPPDSILYPSEEVELGVENSLICFVNNFFPPSINVIWTKNGDVVSEGVSLSRYYPNNDQTFRQFSTLTFTPKQGDMYSCTVEHPALERPNTRIWEVDLGHPSIGLDIYCGVGLTVALLGVATGTFLMAKAHFVQ